MRTINGRDLAPEDWRSTRLLSTTCPTVIESQLADQVQLRLTVTPIEFPGEPDQTIWRYDAVVLRPTEELDLDDIVSQAREESQAIADDLCQPSYWSFRRTEIAVALQATSSYQGAASQPDAQSLAQTHDDNGSSPSSTDRAPWMPMESEQESEQRSDARRRHELTNLPSASDIPTNDQHCPIGHSEAGQSGINVNGAESSCQDNLSRPQDLVEDGHWRQQRHGQTDKAHDFEPSSYHPTQRQNAASQNNGIVPEQQHTDEGDSIEHTSCPNGAQVSQDEVEEGCARPDQPEQSQHVPSTLGKRKRLKDSSGGSDRAAAKATQEWIRALYNIVQDGTKALNAHGSPPLCAWSDDLEQSRPRSFSDLEELAEQYDTYSNAVTVRSYQSAFLCACALLVHRHENPGRQPLSKKRLGLDKNKRARLQNWAASILRLLNLIAVQEGDLALNVFVALGGT